MLVLLNGAPGSGKSTLAAIVAADRPMALALDVDAIKHALGGWRHDPYASGVQARRIALAAIARHLGDGFDVVVSQYLARTDFIEALESTAASCGARYAEIVLSLDAAALARRIQDRHAAPDRPEHAVNNTLVRPEDAADLVAGIDRLRAQRPRAVVVDAAGPPGEVAAAVTAAIDAAAPQAPPR